MYRQEGPAIYLIGLVHGHWDAKLTEEDVAVQDQNELRAFNMGMAVVVPAQKIVETLNQPALVAMRTEREEKRLAKNVPTPDQSSAVTWPL